MNGARASFLSRALLSLSLPVTCHQICCWRDEFQLNAKKKMSAFLIAFVQEKKGDPVQVSWLEAKTRRWCEATCSVSDLVSTLHASSRSSSSFEVMIQMQEGEEQVRAWIGMNDRATEMENDKRGKTATELTDSLSRRLLGEEFPKGEQEADWKRMVHPSSTE